MCPYWEIKSSNKIKASLKRFWKLLFIHYFRMELGTFLCVLEDTRDFDWTTPVHIIETLSEYQFRKYSFFHFWVWVNDFVMIWNNAPSVRVLRNKIKVIIFGNDVCVNKCSSSDILSVVTEKSFRCFCVYHDNLKGWYLFTINFFSLLKKLVNKIFFQNFYLIHWTTVCK